MERVGVGKERVEMMSTQSGVSTHEILRAGWVGALIITLYKRRAEILGLPPELPPSLSSLIWAF